FALRFDGAGLKLAHAALERAHHVIVAMPAIAGPDFRAGMSAGHRPAHVPGRLAVPEGGELVARSGPPAVRGLYVVEAEAIVSCFFPRRARRRNCAALIGSAPVARARPSKS